MDELRTQERGQWPESERIAHSPEAPERRTSVRTIRGARHFIEYAVETFKNGRLSSKGTVTLSDSTAVDWYLWDGPRPQVGSYAAVGGYVAALYRNELYDVSAHMATFRSFGISESSVRSRVWLIIRPPEADERTKHFGVYPRTDRKALHIRGGPNAGGSLPMAEWGSEFADKMAPEILAAIRLARAGGEGTVTDPTWRERLAERFGPRWRIVRLRSRRGGPFTVEPLSAGTAPARARAVRTVARHSSPAGGSGGARGSTEHGSSARI